MKGVGITMISHLDGQDLQRTEKYVTGLNSTEKIGFYEGVMGYARFSSVPESKILAACAAMHEDVALCENAVESSK